jgi:hypothetical protein
MRPMETAPEDKRNFFILKPLLDEIVEEPANENLQTCFPSCDCK